jgi:flagellar biosynthesis/type III secretory pathway protein FliH
MLTAIAAGVSEKTSKLTTTEADEIAKKRLLVEQELAKLCAKLGQQVEAYSSNYLETIEQFRELTVRLAMEIATAVVRYEVTDKEDRIRNLLQEFFAEQDPATTVVAYVNKLDLEVLRTSLQENQTLNNRLQLKSDPGMAQGDVRIETAEQRMIARCEQQLSSIQLQLMEYLSDARPRPANH